MNSSVKEDNSGGNYMIENIPKTTLKIPPDLMLCTNIERRQEENRYRTGRRSYERIS